MIYNSSDSNKSVATIDFGGDKTSTAGDFTIVAAAYYKQQQRLTTADYSIIF